MNVTLIQFAPRLNRSNLDFICYKIEKYSSSDLVVFPELALNGYLLQDKLYEDAFELSELDKLAKLSKNVDIVVGCALKDGKVFKNSALYFSGGKLLSKHDKVHLPNYGMFEEARYFEAGNVFESFVSRFGKVSMLVCEDMWHKSVHHDLIKENPDYIMVLVASPARGFNDDGLDIEKKWYDILKTVASECGAKVIFVNRVGFEDGLGFWGGSCILDEDANFIAKLPLFRDDIQTLNI
jgi:predicted amidohydrolase